MKDRLLGILDSAVDETNRRRVEKIDRTNLADLRLYGSSGVFDSMQLVNFLSLVEEKLEDELGLAVSLTSDRAVSRRISPFSSVRHLIDFIQEEAASGSTAAAG